MAHVGQKLGLGQVRALGGGGELTQLAFGLATFRRVRLEHGLLLAQLFAIAVRLQQRDDHAGDQLQEACLFGIQVARPIVDRAHRAEGHAIGRGQRIAGVKADARCRLDERIVRKARVQPRVTHDQRIARFDDMPTKRNRARRLGRVQAEARFEPLALEVHQRDQGDRHVQQLCHQGRQRVQARVGRRVEDRIRLQRSQAFDLVRWS